MEQKNRGKSQFRKSKNLAYDRFYMYSLIHTKRHIKIKLNKNLENGLMHYATRHAISSCSMHRVQLTHQLATAGVNGAAPDGWNGEGLSPYCGASCASGMAQSWC